MGKNWVLVKESIFGVTGYLKRLEPGISEPVRVLTASESLAERFTEEQAIALGRNLFMKPLRLRKRVSLHE